VPVALVELTVPLAAVVYVNDVVSGTDIIVALVTLNTALLQSTVTNLPAINPCTELVVTVAVLPVLATVLIALESELCNGPAIELVLVYSTAL
jgi:hypothetical protein